MQAPSATRAEAQPAIQWGMDSKTLRRQNLTALAQRLGSLAELERRTSGEVTASYASQIRNGYREMGDQIARRLEVAFGLPKGWMDQHHAQGNGTGGTIRGSVEVGSVVTEFTPGALTPATYSIPALDVGGSMGAGRALPEYETVVGKLDVNQTWVRSQLPNITSPTNLRMITGYGDSMEGTYNDGDLLFVDTGVHEVRIDAVYVFAVNDELYVKRLQRRPDGTLTVISDNKKYEPYTIDHRDKMRVIGRVVYAWNGRKL